MSAFLQQNFFALFLFTAAMGCAEELPVRAAYVAPPVETQTLEQTPAPAAEPDRRPTAPKSKPNPTPDGPPAQPVDLNEASSEDLQRLPGVGPALAKRILDYRIKRRFKRIQELRRVKGIGPSKFQKLRRHVTVGSVGSK